MLLWLAPVPDLRLRLRFQLRYQLCFGVNLCKKKLKAPNLHFRGFLQPKRPPKLKIFAKIETRKVAKLPSCSSSFFFFIQRGKSAQVMTVILAGKNCIFECEGPPYHLHNYQTDLESDIQCAPFACHCWMPFYYFVRMRTIHHMTCNKATKTSSWLTHSF